MSEIAKNYTEYSGDGLIEIKGCSPGSERIDYRITPRGLAWRAMLQCKLIRQENGARFDLFWEVFIQALKSCGYLGNK